MDAVLAFRRPSSLVGFLTKVLASIICLAAGSMVQHLASRRAAIFEKTL
jgi:hypothetical protein